MTMEPREEAAAKHAFHRKMDAAIEEMAALILADDPSDEEFMEIFDAVVSDENETEILIGKEVARRLDKPYPFE